MALELESLTERIMGAAIEVQGRLGPDLLESVYEKAANTKKVPKPLIAA